MANIYSGPLRGRVFAYSESKLTCHFVVVVVLVVLVLLVVALLVGKKGLEGRKKVEKGCFQLIKGIQI